VTVGSFTERLLPRLKAASISLTADEIRLLGDYWNLLGRWNATVNLTALPLDGSPAHSVDRLIVEPLLACRLMPAAPMTWFDLGSGGGSPAIPLKIAAPRANLVMVESRSRKAAFLREVVRNLGLSATEVLNDRFESVADQRPAAADCITVRAVRPDLKLLTVARRLIKPSGRLVLFESSSGNLPGFVSIDEFSFEQMRTRIRAVVPRGTND
jgi:16S rRNA (guanine527-N7)-methyltransferase